MKYSLAVVSAFAVAVSAIPQGGLTALLGSLPSCSINCATAQLPAVNKCGGVGADQKTLVPCLCKDTEFQKSFAACAEGAGGCDAKGQCDLYTASVAMCKGLPGADSIPKPKDTSSCPAANGGGSGGSGGSGSSSSSAAPAESSPAASSPAASQPAESSPAASSPAATASATETGAAPTGSAPATATGAESPANSTAGAGAGATSAPTYSPSSASSLAVSGFAAILAGVAAIFVL